MSKHIKRSLLVPLEFNGSFDTSVATDAVLTANINVPFSVARVVITSSYSVVLDTNADVLLTSSLVYDQPILVMNKRFVTNSPLKVANDQVESCFEYVYPRMAKIQGDFDINFHKITVDTSSSDAYFSMNLTFYNYL